MMNRTLARHYRDRQSAFDRAHTTIEREFADAENVNQVLLFRKLAVRTEYSQRDRQIETRAFFANVRGREVDRRLLKRKEITAVLNRGADAFARLAHRGVRKSDNR